MQIKLLHQINITTDDAVLTATLSNENEIVAFLDSGELVKYKIKEQEYQSLFSVKSSMGYSDGGFDIAAPSTIYTLGDIVVIVNDYKRHGWIHYPGKYTHLHLWRGEYHASISRYPVALFKNEAGIPHIIYAADWNHVQIMNLDTRQLLTADKSLIEENAEERHIEFFTKYKEDNKLPWPRAYDYFFGKLHLSPDSKIFLSAGWIWGSFDYYNAYSIEHFIKSNRIKDIPVFTGEHTNRAACWINETTFAITQNPFTEDVDEATKDSPNEILYYTIKENKAELKNKVQTANPDIVGAEIAYNNQLDAIVAFSKEIGVAVISLEGEIIFHNADSDVDNYNAGLNLFHKIEGNSISIYQIIN